MSKTALSNLPEAEALEASRAAWRRAVETELKGASFDKKLLTRTYEGVTLNPLYTRADPAARSLDSTTPEPVPGEVPFLRGTRAAGYASGAWEVAQEIAAATPEEFNRRLREDLMGGQDAVSLVAASPARPDGLGLCQVGALEVALAGVVLDSLPVHINAGADATSLADEYLKIAALHGYASTALRGSLTADPFAVWAFAGALPGEFAQSLDSLATWTARAARLAPGLRTIGVDARVWAEGGGTAVHELACALATATEYLRALTARSVPLDVSVPGIRVTFGAGPQFLMETAKFRAWRPLLTRVVIALGGDPSLVGRSAVHAATTRWNKTRLDPHVNMLRATTEAFAAVLGGVDSLDIAPYDAPGGGESGTISRRIARNIHVLLAEEFGAVGPADPAGGSWCVESLTDDLARKAWQLFQSFEAAGGFAAALRVGAVQTLIVAAAREKAQAVGARRHGLIGTNLFPNLKETPLPLPPERLVNASWTAWTAERITPIKAFRAASGFEALRDASEAFAVRTGARPRVFLAKIGPVLQHKARADFAAGFFAPGGFEIIAKQSFSTAGEAAAAAAASGAQIAVLCSTDETYPELVPAFATAVRTARPDLTLALAGLPADDAVRAAFTTAGIDLFIHLRASAEETLAQLLTKIGALA